MEIDIGREKLGLVDCLVQQQDLRRNIDEQFDRKRQNVFLRDFRKSFLAFLSSKFDREPWPTFPQWTGHEPDVPESAKRLQIRKSTGYEGLLTLLGCSQQIRDGKLRYLLTGGYAVQAQVEASGGIGRRNHNDTDLISLTRSELPLSDNYSGGVYVGTIFYDELTLARDFTDRIDFHQRRFLRDHMIITYTTSPEFLVISKLIGFGRTPRPKDIVDIRDLLQYCPIDSARLKDAADLSRFRSRSCQKHNVTYITESLLETKSLPFARQSESIRTIAGKVLPDLLVARFM